MRDHNESASHESEVFMLSIGLKSADADSVDNILEEADEEMFKKKAAQSRQKLYNALTSNNLDEMRKSDNFVAVLIKNLTEREPHFLEHARHVMVWSQAICQMIGADDDTIERVSLAALLHDIGKIALPSGLLTKTTPLTKEDWRHIRQHPVAGSDFLSGHKFLGDLRIIINHHHERWDGRVDGPHPGYPSGFAGELIPLGSRVIRVAETFDDLVSPRPYRAKPFTTSKALEILEEDAGKSLDPHLVRVFVDYVQMINSPLAAM
jgi:HD-GYP domain-containing protein (c-di-GMP phosphodiesterase class II)